MTDLLDLEETPVLSGAGLLGLVTNGMYDDPLSIYREYIQNAADAVEGSGFSGRVDVIIDATGRRIKIRDKGPGLSHGEALERLLPIGRSDKSLETDRGFRGVGRLAGLAFAKTVTFTTRASEDQPVTRVTWHSDRLPELTSVESELGKAILDCVDVETMSGKDYPGHFFDVDIGGVARHSAGLLLNRDAVRDYIGEVCPVPLSAEFPFAESVKRLLDGAKAPLTLEVVLEGDTAPLQRPYGESIRHSTNKAADFTEFQVVRIPSIDASCEAAVGWVAHSSYFGAIPREQRVRGIRARVGNIQIGGEAVFDHLFTEERFNRWCVGELHILDSRIISNTRRDYFQPGPHLRNLENKLKPVLRGISTRCRRESTARNRARNMISSLTRIEDLHALATSGYLNTEDSDRLVQKALREVEELRKSIGTGDLDNGSLERLDSVEYRLNNSQVETEVQRFGDMTHPEVVVYQRVFGTLSNLAYSPGYAKELIEMVFAEACEWGKIDPDMNPDQGTGNHSQTRLVLNPAGER